MTTLDRPNTSNRRTRGQRLATALSGNIVYTLTQAAALAVITRSENGAIDAADFLLAQAVATPIGIFVSARIRDQLATEGVRSALRPRLVRLGWMSAIALVIGSASWLVAADGQRAATGIAILIANLAQVLTTVYQGRAIRSDRFRASSTANAALGLSSLLSFIVGYRYGGLVLASSLLAASWLAIGISLVLASLQEEAKDKPAPQGRPRPLVDDLSVGLAATATVGQPSVARIGIAIVDSAAGLATFGTVTQLSRLGSLLVNGVKAAISPELAHAVEADNLDGFLHGLRNRIRAGVAGLGVVGFAGGLLLGPWLVETLFSASVRPEALTAAAVFGLAPCLYAAMVLTQVAIAANRSNRLMFASLSGLATTGLLIVPLGWWQGPTGAALALGAGHLVRFVLLDHLILPKRVEGTP